MNFLWLILIDNAEYSTEEGIIRFSSLESAHNYAHNSRLHDLGEVSYKQDKKE